VYRGANPADWAIFDHETRSWRDTGLQVFPVLGNHDLEGDPSVALTNYFSRFPAVAQRRWYSLRAGNVLLFAIDSASNHSPGSPQLAWLQAGLENVPSGVDFILVAVHHPPYTESSDHMPGGGHDAREQEKVLAQVLESAQQKIKARIVVLSGHVHNYERYQHGGVMYVVSGGGGGTPYMIPRLPGDFYAEPGPTYHFCKFTASQNRLQFQMLKYLGPNQWAVKDQFELHSK
jgi:3',5'-cyclic AMP phosphodiesterase CpdA